MIGSITVNSVATPTLSSPVRPSSSQFQFSISGSAGQTYIIERSGNLTNWVAIATNVAIAAPLSALLFLLTRKPYRAAMDGAATAS